MVNKGKNIIHAKIFPSDIINNLMFSYTFLVHQIKSFNVAKSVELLISIITTDCTINGIGEAIGRGTMISIVLVMFVLPQILLLGDTLIQRTIDNRQSPYTSGSTTYYPGADYSYSNVGFCVLHRIVEVLSGKDYEKFLKEDVLAKMGITDTHIGGYLEDRRPNECVFYSQGGGDGYRNPLRELAGAAGIITSTNQMMRILTYMDGDDTVPDIFTPETLADMYTPHKYTASSYNRYGQGWRMNHSRLFPGAHYPGGNIAGTATIWAGNTNQHMSGAFVCNSRAYNSNATGDIDDNMYVLLDEFMNYFNN